MESTIIQIENENKLTESINYILNLTKSHFQFLTHPLSDLEDKVNTTNIFLNHFFKALTFGFSSLSQNININNLQHFITFKNYIGLKDCIEADPIANTLNHNILSYQK